MGTLFAILAGVLVLTVSNAVSYHLGRTHGAEDGHEDD